MDPRRAGWRIAVENTGIDGGVGAIVRAHNAFAGGGLQLVGGGRYNKRATAGTHQHEPIRVLDAPEGAPLVAVEADPVLPPLPDALWPDATYLLGHDGLGLSPALAATCDARFGPPRGWGPATSPVMLAHLLLWRLRHPPAHPPGSELTRVGVVHGAQHGSARPGGGAWAGLTRAQQRAALPFDWWVERFAWAQRRDWWVHLPDAQTPLNAVMACRNALAAGAAGVITAADPGPGRAPLGDRWRVQGFDDVVAWARAEGRAVVALEQGGTPLAGTVLPDAAVLVAGHEVRGLSPPHLRACDAVVALPQWGSVNSLNVASAAGLVLDATPSQPPSAG